jgi:hypothetical protein
MRERASRAMWLMYRAGLGRVLGAWQRGGQEGQEGQRRWGGGVEFPGNVGLVG